MKLSIVVPCYNEEPVLQETTARLSAVLDSLIEKQKISSDSFILYVNDGSRDKTWTLIMSLHEGNPYVKGLNLAGNVGHQNALMAGLMVAKEYADILVSIDADLQDDVSVIEEMVDRCIAASGNRTGSAKKLSREDMVRIFTNACRPR